MLAVGCPFCKCMLESTPGKGESPLAVKDVAELLWEGVQRQAGVFTGSASAPVIEVVEAAEPVAAAAAAVEPVEAPAVVAPPVAQEPAAAPRKAWKPKAKG